MVEYVVCNIMSDRIILIVPNSYYISVKSCGDLHVNRSTAGVATVLGSSVANI